MNQSNSLLQSATLILAAAGLGSSPTAHAGPAAGSESRRSTEVKPITRHPLNPHYLEFRGEPTLLLTSGEHYGSVLNLDFDYVVYLDALESNGLNLTRTFAGTFRAPGTYSTPLDPVGKDHFACPYAWSVVAGGLDGEKFDLDTWNTAYFERLHDFLRQAARRNIVVELVFLSYMYSDAHWARSPYHPSNNIQSAEEDFGISSHTKFVTLEKPDLVARQKQLARKITQELQPDDNVYFEICNEPFIADPAEYVPWHDAIIDHIQPHLMEHMVAVNYHDISAMSKIHPAVDILNGHYVGPANPGERLCFEIIDAEYGRSPALVLGFDETSWINTPPEMWKPNTMSPDEGRVEAWEYLLGGGAIYDGLNGAYQPGSEAGDSKESSRFRGYLQKLRQFMDGLEYVRMHKDDHVIADVAVTGNPEATHARAIAERGRQYGIYLHHCTPHSQRLHYVLQSGLYEATLTLDLPPGAYTVQWVRPTDLAILRTDAIADHRGGPAELRASPTYKVDVAMKISGRPR